MKRLRFFRILLPAILVPFLVLVGLELRKRVDPWSPPSGMTQQGSTARGIEFTDLEGPDKRFKLEAESYTEDVEGKQHLRGIRPLTVFRDSGEELKISADFADWEGELGQRFVRIEGGIEVREEDDGLLIHIPVLEIDEAAKEARSLGGVRFEGPGLKGTAASVTYPLDRKPTVFRDLTMSLEDTYRIRSETATRLQSGRELLLERDVRLLGPDMELTCETMQVFRDEDGSLEKVIASGAVRGDALLDGERNARMRSGTLEVTWSGNGEADFLLLDQEAVLQLDDQGLAAMMVRVSRRDRDDGLWDFLAAGGVFLSGSAEDSPINLQASRIEGLLEADGKLKEADVSGAIRFTGPDSLAEADHGWLSRSGQAYDITLYSSPLLRARVSSDRQRITGQTIRLRTGSQYILADGRVEATLLSEAEAAGDGGMFRKGEAVHFVARTMEGSPDGSTIRFTEDVRGWQGERTLSAAVIEIRNPGGDLLAEGKVGTRIPGRPSDSLSDADFIHITGSRLEYDGEDGTAVYTGGVHVRQDEGWLETDRLEAELQSGGSGLRVMRALGNVVLEYRVRDRAGMPQQVQGDADRAEYEPEAGTVRLFGDHKRATLRRSGAEAVTIYGRILRYHLDEGTIEVEQGLSGRSRIQTPQGGREEPSGGD